MIIELYLKMNETYNKINTYEDELKDNITEELKDNTKIIIPEPSELKISTMTCLCLLNVEINLDILSRFVNVYDIKDDEITKGKGGIVYVDYFMILPRGQYCGKKAQVKKKDLQNNDKLLKYIGESSVSEIDSEIQLGDIFKDKPNKSKKQKKKHIKKRQFENQATLIFHFNNDRSVNIKVFHNGKIQMTGVRSVEEANWIITRLIDIIKETSVHLIDKKEMNNPSFMIKNQYIYTTIIKNDDNDKNDTNNDDKNEKVINTIYRYIKCNGSYKWIEINDDRVKELKMGQHAVEDNSKIKMTNYESVMINSNYSLGFNIDRNKLHLLLKRKYNIYATLESTYQAVKSYYFFNSKSNSSSSSDTIKENNSKGICQCEVPCFVLKEKNKKISTPCSQVTIAVFRTGSVIITGGCTIEQTKEAYHFINKLIKDNFNLLYQKEEQQIKLVDKTNKNIDSSLENDPISIIKNIMIDRANENKRRTKKINEVKPKNIKNNGIDNNNINDNSNINNSNDNSNQPKSELDNGIEKIKKKRGRKPKSFYINSNEIIDNPYSN